MYVAVSQSPSYLSAPTIRVEVSVFRAGPRRTSIRKCRAFEGDCDLLPPPLVLNLGHRKERPALSGAFFPQALGSQACEGSVLRGAFPPAFSTSCFSFPHTVISPAQRSLALAALMHALPGSPFLGLHLLQGPSP